MFNGKVKRRGTVETHTLYTEMGEEEVGLVWIAVVADSRVPIKLTKSKTFRQISSS